MCEKVSIVFIDGPRCFGPYNKQTKNNNNNNKFAVGVFCFSFLNACVSLNSLNNKNNMIEDRSLGVVDHPTELTLRMHVFH